MMMLTKYKGMLPRICVLAASLLFSGTIYGQNSQSLTPYDFYQGSELSENNEKTPFAWVELPSEAYMNSAHSKTLQDVRVFNGTGQEVPSALFFDSEESSETSQIPFSLQPLIIKADQVSSKEETLNERQYLLVEVVPSKVSRIEIPSLQNRQDVKYQAFLLTRKSEQQRNLPIQTLSLDWDSSQQDWQAKSFIYASQDKQRWINISTNQPIMSLNSHAGEIRSNTIELLSGNDPALMAPYLMVITVADKEAHIPDLKSAEGTAKVFHSTRRQETCNFTTNNEGMSLNQLIYRLPSAQPLSSIAIHLQQTNRVLPLQIEYTANSGENWLPLSNIVAYNQINDGKQVRNPDVSVNGLMVKKLRITALKGSWDDKPPYVEGKRDAVNLVFNMQGASPYLLAWGSQLATLDNLSYQELLGQSLTVEQLMHRYPELSVSNEIIELGGEEQLTSNISAEGYFDWMTGILWGLLGFGILILVYFCWYLIKEINSKSSK
ncbi:DUF3999 family protein [Providencia manganoxydans]|uniref:DUF3999 family protein n=1 Tax=Providencia manganoxydans TaxID=2923283 RepID=UPI0032DAA2C2